LQVYGSDLPAKLNQMLTSGIPVTINSDDPAYFGPAYLNDNYEFIARVGALGPDQLAQLAKNSFSASFIDDAAKAAAHGQIDEVLAAWKSEQQQQRRRPLLVKWFAFV
jgi:adenosine deaminase